MKMKLQIYQGSSHWHNVSNIFVSNILGSIIEIIFGYSDIKIAWLKHSLAKLKPLLVNF
jgi:hypothetical protein